MGEKCEKPCSGLTRLEQQVDDLQNRNGTDHKEFRERMSAIEMEESRQKERFDRIFDSLNDLKSDNKEVLSKLSPLTHKVESLESLSTDVDEMKGKSAKNWEDIKKQLLTIVVAAIAGIILAKIGLHI